MTLAKSLQSSLLCLLFTVLAGCGASAPTKSNGATSVSSSASYSSSAQANWWNDAVFYQVFPRSFYDATGADGIGDIPGVMKKLDYLNDNDPATSSDLGVKAIWLTSVVEASDEAGYAPTNIFKVDEDYGTNEQFKQFVDAAHQRNLKVVMDLPINHLSSSSAKFQAALNGDTAAKDWFVWRPKKPKDLYAYGRQVWHKSDIGYYYGFFGESAPDLNLRNKEVRDELFAATTFWIQEMGVDGIGIDGAQYLVEEGSAISDTLSTLAFLSFYQTHIKSMGKHLFTVADLFTDMNTAAKYQAEHVDASFQSELAKQLVNAVNLGKGGKLLTALSTLEEKYAVNQAAIFLSNHESVRSMTILNRQESAKLAASILFTLPGIPFIYYGDEIGMSGRLPVEFVRTPMRWDSDLPNMGFSNATPWTPLNDDFDYVNVRKQQASSRSLLNWYKEMIQLHHDNVALKKGKFTMVETSHEDVIAYLRTTKEQKLLVVVNLNAAGKSDYSLSLDGTILSGSELISGKDIGAGTPKSKPIAVLAPKSLNIIQIDK